MSLSQIFGSLLGANGRPAAAQPLATTTTNTSMAIKQAIQTGKSAAEMIASFPSPCSDRNIDLVESYLNRNCPREFSHLVVKFFNQSQESNVEAIQSGISIRPIKLRVKSEVLDIEGRHF